MPHIVKKPQGFNETRYARRVDLAVANAAKDRDIKSNVCVVIRHLGPNNEPIGYPESEMAERVSKMLTKLGPGTVILVVAVTHDAECTAASIPQPKGYYDYVACICKEPFPQVTIP